MVELINPKEGNKRIFQKYIKYIIPYSIIQCIFYGCFQTRQCINATIHVFLFSKHPRWRLAWVSAYDM